MNKRFENKTVVITGGSSGLGFDVAERFVAEGAQVIILARTQEALDTATAKLGPQAHGIRCDISDGDDIAAAFRKISNQFERLDVVFANAGIVEVEPLVGVSPEQYDAVFDTCVRGTLLTVQRAVPLMQSGGSIILNGAVIADKGNPGLGLNAAAKSAVRSLGRTLAVELGAKNIRVNTVSPGTIETPLLQKSGMPQEAVDAMNSDESPIPLRRIGQPKDISAAVLFLASEESSYITGVNLPVDGGAAQV